MRFRGTRYRAHDPRWAFSPLSGHGAKARGGRFNPIGTPALYLSLTLILVPSFAIGARSDMRNLVLWRWGADLPYRVAVHDPHHRLPKDQASWR